MNRMIDLRSDTLTRPTAAMRRAMMNAEVGDDLFGEDPAVRALEERTAEILGKEAAMFVPSGTMGNQIGLRLHTSPGDQVLIEGGGHIFNTEAGAPGLLSGVVMRPLAGRRGVIGAELLRSALPVSRPYMVDTVLAPVTLLCVENTHNASGGSVWPLDDLRATAHVASDHGLGLHLDGARIWNAAVASGTAEAEIAAPFHTVSVCFSKGLGAPVGSALVGTTSLIRRARRYRQAFGGGMRQAGIIAAGALHALEHHRVHLREDHANARRLAEGLAEIPGIRINPGSVETNIVRFELEQEDASAYAMRCHDAGVHLIPMGENVLRAVTYFDLAPEDIGDALIAMRTALSGAQG